MLWDRLNRFVEKEDGNMSVEWVLYGALGAGLGLAIAMSSSSATQNASNGLQNNLWTDYDSEIVATPTSFSLTPQLWALSDASNFTMPNGISGTISVAGQSGVVEGNSTQLAISDHSMNSGTHSITFNDAEIPNNATLQVSSIQSESWIGHFSVELEDGTWHHNVGLVVPGSDELDARGGGMRASKLSQPVAETGTRLGLDSTWYAGDPDGGQGTVAVVLDYTTVPGITDDNGIKQIQWTQDSQVDTTTHNSILLQAGRENTH